MRATEVPAERRRVLVLLRWGLIALCALLIVSSDHMAGRTGFAALLLLAVILGRYGGGWYARRWRGAKPLDQSLQQRCDPSAPEAPARRRGAGT